MTTQQTINATTTIRRMDLDESDREAVLRLAERDSRDPIEGPVLGIEVEGELVAVTSLTTGETIADPFVHSEQQRALLSLRAAQLDRRVFPEHGRRLGRRRRLAVGGGPAGHVNHLPRLG